MLRRLISPTNTRARIYDRDGALIVDSRHLYSRGQILRFDLPPPEGEEQSLFDRVWRAVNYLFQRSDLPVYKELGAANGKGYPEIITALAGTSNSIVRVTERGELIVSVAVPIQRYRSVYGALLLSTQGGDIDTIVHAERLAIVRVFAVAARRHHAALDPPCRHHRRAASPPRRRRRPGPPRRQFAARRSPTSPPGATRSAICRSRSAT